MGFRFRKSFKVIPGIRLNLSKSGFSTSIGGKGMTFNLGKRGIRSTVGLPGTGLSYSTLSSTSTRRTRRSRSNDVSSSSEATGDVASTVSGILSLGLTTLLGRVLPSMPWWSYVLIFLGIGAAILALIESAKKAVQSPSTEVNGPAALGDVEALSDSLSVSETEAIAPSVVVPELRTPVPLNQKPQLLRVAIVVAAILLLLLILPLMPWWVYLIVAPLSALCIILLIDRRAGELEEVSQGQKPAVTQLVATSDVSAETVGSVEERTVAECEAQK